MESGRDQRKPTTSCAHHRGDQCCHLWSGPPTVLFVTEGFKDVLFIREGHRYDMFDPQIEYADPSCRIELGVAERTLANGTLMNIDEAQTGSSPPRREGVGGGLPAERIRKRTNEQASATFCCKNGRAIRVDLARGCAADPRIPVRERYT